MKLLLLMMLMLCAIAAAADPPKPPDPPKVDPLSDKDAKAYLTSALAKARAIAAQASVALKYLENEKAAEAAAAELAKTVEKLKLDHGCPKCEIDDATLTWITPESRAGSSYYGQGTNNPVPVPTP